MKIKTVKKLQERINADAEFKVKIQQDPIGTINEVTDEVGRNDKWVYRIVVIALSLTVLFIIIFSLVLILLEKNGSAIPEIFTSTASLALGALVGLLAPQPNADEN